MYLPSTKEPPRLDDQAGRPLLPRTRPVIHEIWLGDTRLAWCEHSAARYAVENWHYSRSLPFGKCVEIGVWEGGGFIGCIQFGLGSNHRIGKPWGLEPSQVCELQRVALQRHTLPVSQLVSASVKMLRRHSPGLLLIVSYADPEQGHVGGIYQAMNWLYVGTSRPQSELLIAGKFMHKRSAYSLYGTASTKKLQAQGIDAVVAPVQFKHKYVLPLKRNTFRLLRECSKPYPKKEML